MAVKKLSELPLAELQAALILFQIIGRAAGMAESIIDEGKVPTEAEMQTLQAETSTAKTRWEALAPRETDSAAPSTVPNTEGMNLVTP